VRRLDAGQWLVRIDGALPAYISAGQYERNLARLAANRARAESPGAPREGPALVACGTCGHRLQVSYETSRQGLTGRYCCQRRHHAYGEARCQQMAAPFLDEHVVAQVLSALAPAALELSVSAAGQVEDRRAEIDHVWRQRLERSDLRCDRARRQYQLAEPENRLVARQLEREWEAALAERASLGEEYERHQQQRPVRLTAPELAAIRALARDIPALWAAPTTTMADRKRLLRVATPGAGSRGPGGAWLSRIVSEPGRSRPAAVPLAPARPIGSAPSAAPQNQRGLCGGAGAQAPAAAHGQAGAHTAQAVRTAPQVLVHHRGQVRPRDSRRQATSDRRQ